MPGAPQRTTERRSASRAVTFVILAAAAALVALGIVLLHREPQAGTGETPTHELTTPRRASTRAATRVTTGLDTVGPAALSTPPAPVVSALADASTPATPDGLIPGIPSRSLPTHPLIFHHPDAAPPE